MTEREWSASTDNRTMIHFLGDQATCRKLQLYACACCRRVPFYDPQVISLIEGYADRAVKRKDAQAAVKVAIPAGGINVYCRNLFWVKTCHFGADITAAFTVEGPVGAMLLRCIFGNPFRPVSLRPAWLTPPIDSLARSAYEERILPSGELDPERLAVLSDALEEAGCTDSAILDHLRLPGPHVRGCWALDIILGKQ